MTAAMTHPATAQAISRIEALGLGWKLEADYDLSKLSVDRRIQVRDSKHYAPKFMVDRYAAQMEVTAFPPIIVTVDDWIVDGNTRVAGRKEQMRKSGGAGQFDAIVIDVAYASATQGEQNDLYRLGAEMNSINGKPLTADEQRKAVRASLAQGVPIPEIVGGLGITSATIKNMQYEIKAEERLTSLGVAVKLNADDDKSPLRTTALGALGRDRVFLLNSEVFKSFAVLARDASYEAKEIKELADELASIDGDDAKMLRIAERTNTDATKQRVSMTKISGRAKPAYPAKLRQSLGTILNPEIKVESFIERNPGEPMDNHIARVREAIAVLNEVLSQNVALSESLVQDGDDD